MNLALKVRLGLHKALKCLRLMDLWVRDSKNVGVHDCSQWPMQQCPNNRTNEIVHEAGGKIIEMVSREAMMV